MKNKYPLLTGLILSSIIFFSIGILWNINYYKEQASLSVSALPINYFMKAFHDGVVISNIDSLGDSIQQSLSGISNKQQYVEVTHDSPKQPESQKSLDVVSENINNDTTVTNTTDTTTPLYIDLSEFEQTLVEDNSSESEIQPTVEVEEAPKELSFTSTTDDYFSDAVFIGDSRTVGINLYSGIKNATFLCATSLTIYDYTRPKIEYNNKKTSIHDVLTQVSFNKVYIMFGINECSYGTTEDYYNSFKEVVEDIRQLQPEALIFIEGNLLVTEQKSNTSGIKNSRLIERNDAIATLANQTDIFYININESSLCENNALIKEYTWDDVHIKAQYYAIWKDFLLDHAIIA